MQMVCAIYAHHPPCKLRDDASRARQPQCQAELPAPSFRAPGSAACRSPAVHAPAVMRVTAVAAAAAAPLAKMLTNRLVSMPARVTMRTRPRVAGRATVWRAAFARLGVTLWASMLLIFAKICETAEVRHARGADQRRRWKGACSDDPMRQNQPMLFPRNEADCTCHSRRKQLARIPARVTLVTIDVFSSAVVHLSQAPILSHLSRSRTRCGDEERGWGATLH
jgi:hypothetical protein